MPPTKSAPGARPAERVFLIDSMSHIFRAFYAPLANRAAPLMNSKGQVTQAIFIFTNMLRKLLQDEKPKYLGAVFESKEKTFRHESFADYKATREAMPDDLALQLPYIIRLCEVYNVPVITVPGFEADDVIGTLAVKAADRGLQAVIVSNDKDMCQLVRDPAIVCMRQNSQVVKRKAPVPPIEWCDEAWVQKKFGVPAEKLVDLLGLMGDSIDNIPGARGVGPKGAVQIIHDYGSIDNALQHWEEIKNKRYRESLRDNADLIRKSGELAQIKTDVEIELDLDQLQVRPPDRARAYELFRELEFQNLTNEFADAAVAPAQVGPARQYSIIENQSELERLMPALWEAEHIGIALSNSSPAGAGQQQSPRDGHGARGIALSARPGISAFVDLETFREGKEVAIASLREFLTNGLLEKSVHDLKRASSLLAPFDIQLEGVADDTLLAAYVLDPSRSKYELADLAREAINVDTVGPPAGGWSENAWQTTETADLTARVAPVLHQRINEKDLGMIYRDIELPLAPLLYRIERAGICIDCEVLADLSRHLGEELEKLTQRICTLAGREFNINSPKQVAECFEALNIVSGRKTSTGRVSTSKAVLEELAQTHELPRLIIEYRELEKLKSVYTDALPHQVAADGRIHGQLNQTVAATGRLSSSDPNLQNIPIRTELGRQIRAAFVAEKGNVLLSADYSQIELRVMAHFSKDPVLVEAFRNGEDIHARTAQEVFGVGPLGQTAEHRRAAKAINFGIIYGLSPFGLAQQLGIEQKEAAQFINAYFARYRGVKEYLDNVLAETRKTGVAKTMFGRIRPIPEITSPQVQLRNFAERTALNSPLQGTAADLIKLAMINIDRRLTEEEFEAQMILQVHDELLFESPAKESARLRKLVKEEMEGVHQLAVPIVVEIGVGPNWRDLD